MKEGRGVFFPFKSVNSTLFDILYGGKKRSVVESQSA